MYRKLVWVPVLAFCVLAAAMASLAGGPWDFRSSLPVAGLYARAAGWLPANLNGNLRVAAVFYLTGLAPLALGGALTWFAAFNPGRRAGWPLAALKYAAAAAVTAFFVIHMYYRAAGVATGAHALALQTASSLPAVLLSSGFLDIALEMAALSLVLTAPLYWLIRGVKTASLQRATFEAWVEVRRLIPAALLLLLVATALDVWATPALAAALLR